MGQHAAAPVARDDGAVGAAGWQAFDGMGASSSDHAAGTDGAPGSEDDADGGMGPGDEAEGLAALDGGEEWQSEWAKGGWLLTNPLGVPTEREVLVQSQGGSIYRIMLVRQ